MSSTSLPDSSTVLDFLAAVGDAALRTSAFVMVVHEEVNKARTNPMNQQLKEGAVLFTAASLSAPSAPVLSAMDFCFAAGKLCATLAGMETEYTPTVKLVAKAAYHVMEPLKTYSEQHPNAAKVLQHTAVAAVYPDWAVVSVMAEIATVTSGVNFNARLAELQTLKAVVSVVGQTVAGVAAAAYVYKAMTQTSATAEQPAASSPKSASTPAAQKSKSTSSPPPVERKKKKEPPKQATPATNHTPTKKPYNGGNAS